MNSKAQNFELCALCLGPSRGSCLLDQDKNFCCQGCLAVYNILSAKGELHLGIEHPLVKTAAEFGIIAHDDLLSKIHCNEEAKVEAETLKLYLDIEGLWCPSCAEIIRLTLMQEKGVARCTVDFATDLAFIEYQPLLVSKERIVDTIAALGYAPKFIEDSARKKASPKLKLQLALLSFLSINLMMLSSPIYVSYFMQGTDEYGYLFALISLFFALPALFIARDLFNRSWQQARFGFIGMEALVSTGVLTAFILSTANLLKGSYHVYFDSMSVILAFVYLGKAMESEAKFSAKESLIRLMQATPKRARKRFEDGSCRFVPIKEIEIGDASLAHIGEKIALDGEVIEGEASIDESLMTGEVRPIKKEKGSLVIGGTFVRAGSLTYRVLQKADKGALQKIVDIIENDLHKKSESHKVIDIISEVFVPVALMISVGAFILGSLTSLETGFDRMLSVILIACPCAIGIAVPLVESSLLTALSSLGIIVRNRRVLSFIGSEDFFLFDKTGTVTEGKFEVVEGLDQFSGEERSLIKAASLASLHPIALAIHRSIEEAPSAGVKAKEIPGLGIESKEVLIGSREFLRLKGIDAPQGIKRGKLETQSFIAIMQENAVKTASILLGDKVKEGVKELIQSLKPIPSILISGDVEEAVSFIGKECFFDHWHASLSPLEKRGVIEELQKKGKVVAMIGDGINDAPSLTLADISISVATASDISVQVSDILLTSERILRVGEMRALVKRGKRIIKQNLFWAFFYNILGVLMAFFGLLIPLYAAFAMAASSLICVVNSKRI